MTRKQCSLCSPVIYLRLTLSREAMTGNPLLQLGCRSISACSKCHNVSCCLVALKIFFISPCVMI